MPDMDDVERAILRNMLLGRWAAEKLGLSGMDTWRYSDELGRDAADPTRGDIFTRLRRDFDAAGVDLADEQILETITEATIRAGKQLRKSHLNTTDAAAVALARNLTSR